MSDQREDLYAVDRHHITHHDDCGCRSKKYELLIKSLRRSLDEIMAAKSLDVACEIAYKALERVGKK
jgi:hypothetical protein